MKPTSHTNSLVSTLRDVFTGGRGNTPTADNEQIAAWLATTPEALAAFEAAYTSFAAI